MVMLQGVETKMISIPAPPAPTDLSQFKLSSPPGPHGPGSKSPDRDSSLSPASSPPSLAPSGVSMVSMASMLSRPPNFGFPGLPFPQGFSPKDFSRPGPGTEYPSMLMHNRQYARSPPPMVSPNDPTANDCKIVEYRGVKNIAAFMINGKTMLCLPQVFELFLKNLVGGLHTVYTKCKRLDVHPMICNVEQVRVLRGLGAIQPGVNRCKLIADSDFDQLYKDCTTSRNQCYTSPAYKIQKINGLNNEQAFDPMPSMSSHIRPGRPPKRVLPFPAPSPQDAMLQLNRSPLVTQDNFSREAGGHPLDGGRFPGAPGGGSFPGGHPMTAAGAAHLMSLNNPAALLSRTGMLPGMPGGLGALPGLPPLHGGPGHALLETYKQQYGDFVKHLQGLHKSQEDEHDDDLEKESDRDTERPRNGSVLNLSAQAQSDLQEGSASSDPGRASDSDIGEPEADIGSETEDMELGKQEEKEAGTGTPGTMFQMMNQIQSLIKMTVEKAKHEEKNNSNQKCDLKDELDKEKESQSAIKRKIEEETKTTDLYLKRFRKERKLRKQLEDQLEMETKKIQALESALRSLSYETLVQVKETIAREAATRETRKVGETGTRDREAGEREREGSDSEMAEVTRGHYDTAPPGYPAASTTASAAASLAQLNYNISQMTSAPSRDRETASPVFSSSLASSLPPSVSNSSF